MPVDSCFIFILPYSVKAMKVKCIGNSSFNINCSLFFCVEFSKSNSTRLC